MVAPLESFDGGFEASVESETLIEDVAFNALQTYLGSDVKLRHYEGLWRKDYAGDPAYKRYVGGALLVEYTVFADESFTKGELTVAADTFAPEVKDVLETQARSNWYHGRGWVRDYGRHQ